MTASAAKLVPVVVTKDELLELADWERKYAAAKKKVSEAEKELKFRRISLAEKVLGVKTEDELKRMPPEKLLKVMAHRLSVGDWKAERGAPDFAFTKTSEGRYPSWSQLYAEELGDPAAQQVRAETPVMYSYAIDVQVPA
jgi:hypothetical protein